MMHVPIDAADAFCVPTIAGVMPQCMFCQGSPAQDRTSIRTTPQVEIETGHPLAPYIAVHVCSECGHGITLPAMADVAPLYDARESEDFLARDAGWVAALKRMVNLGLARKLLRYAPDARSIADFGTGNGALAAAFAQQVAPGGKTTGLDFFDTAPDAIGSASYASFSQAEDRAIQFDLVVCFHVLEHDDDPRKMMASLLAIAKPGATIVIEVPNVECVWNSWFGAACANWYAPYHRVHFSRRSLARLMQEYGLEIIDQRDICGPTFALSLAKLCDATPGAIFFAMGLALRPLQWIAEKITRRPSALRIVVKKAVANEA